MTTRTKFMRGRLGTVGWLGSVLFLGLYAGAAVENLEEDGFIAADLVSDPLSVVYLCIAALFAASAWIPWLRAAQPVALLGLVPVQSFAARRPLSALAFALLASYLLERFGFFRRAGALKIALLALLVAVSELGAAVWRGMFGAALIALACAVVYLCAVLAAYRRGATAVVGGGSKDVLRLERHKLGRRQREIVRARASGKTTKEISREFRIAQSTVRNALSASYRKLGLRGAEELVALAERYSLK